MWEKKKQGIYLKFKQERKKEYLHGNGIIHEMLV